VAPHREHAKPSHLGSLTPFFRVPRAAVQIPGITCGEEALNNLDLTSQQMETINGLLGEADDDIEGGEGGRAALLGKFVDSLSSVGRDYKHDPKTRTALY